jgi:tRNA(Arg) A34 adenosine deaminase TadA
LHPKSSSRCAPNCKAVSLLTSAEPSFLCPVCYNTYLHSQYDEFVHRSETRSRQGERPVEVIVKQVKGGKGDFDKWYDVWLGETTFEKVEKANYRWAVEVEVLRACKAVKEEKENSES